MHETTGAIPAFTGLLIRFEDDTSCNTALNAPYASITNPKYVEVELYYKVESKMMFDLY